MKTQATIVKHSISPAGKEIATLALVYPRFVHAEAKTHRIMNIGDNSYEILEEIGFMDCKDLSRNAMSSRAVPVSKILKQVLEDPAMPCFWGANQPGMVAGAELEGEALEHAKWLWREAAGSVAAYAKSLMDLGLHKQVPNRILEPFQWMHTVVTATEWTNFFKLRLHASAEPNMRALAVAMNEALMASKPVLRSYHLPYIDSHMDLPISDIQMISAARCARVSYLNHDGTAPDPVKDLALARTLLESGHASPFEHVALAMATDESESRNFRGWYQMREGVGL